MSAQPDLQEWMTRASRPVVASPLVLVVEDDPAVREILRLRLELEGFKVLVAATGIEGLRCLDDSPDVAAVVCDISMPALDGPGLWEAVARENPQVAGRFVFVTGGAATPLQAQFLQDVSGLLPVLYKPADLPMLGRTVRRTVDR